MPPQFSSPMEGMSPPPILHERQNLRRILHASGAIRIHGGVSPGESRVRALLKDQRGHLHKDYGC